MDVSVSGVELPEAYSAARLPCVHCGVELHLAVRVDADEFAWVDGDGHSTGTDLDVRHLESCGGAYARLAHLDHLLTAAMAAAGGPHGRKACLTPLYWARAREYSMLKVRLEQGFTFHVHRVRHSDCPVWRGPLVEHCGSPALLRPSGWWCRVCRTQISSGNQRRIG